MHSPVSLAPGTVPALWKGFNEKLERKKERKGTERRRKGREGRKEEWKKGG